MARCPKCYETRCVCDAVQSLTRMGHPFVAVAAHVDGLREHIDVLNQEKAQQSAALAESDIRIAGVEAERDHYRVGLAKSERARAEVVRERDALKAGRWAGPWEFFDGTEYVRMSNTDGVAASARSHGMAGTFGWYSNHIPTDFVGYASIDLAKAACDAALVAAGWYLAKSEEG